MQGQIGPNTREVEFTEPGKGTLRIFNNLVGGSVYSQPDWDIKYVSYASWLRAGTVLGEVRSSWYLMGEPAPLAKLEKIVYHYTLVGSGLGYYNISGNGLGNPPLPTYNIVQAKLLLGATVDINLSRSPSADVLYISIGLREQNPDGTLGHRFTGFCTSNAQMIPGTIEFAGDIYCNNGTAMSGKIRGGLYGPNLEEIGMIFSGESISGPTLRYETASGAVFGQLKSTNPS
jgi:hypothetical protein